MRKSAPATFAQAPRRALADSRSTRGLRCARFTPALPHAPGTPRLRFGPPSAGASAAPRRPEGEEGLVRGISRDLIGRPNGVRDHATGCRGGIFNWPRGPFSGCRSQLQSPAAVSAIEMRRGVEVTLRRGIRDVGRSSIVTLDRDAGSRFGFATPAIGRMTPTRWPAPATRARDPRRALADSRSSRLSRCARIRRRSPLARNPAAPLRPPASLEGASAPPLGEEGWKGGGGGHRRRFPVSAVFQAKPGPSPGPNLTIVTEFGRGQCDPR